jgi:hypothetical protein
MIDKVTVTVQTGLWKAHMGRSESYRLVHHFGVVVHFCRENSS